MGLPTRQVTDTGPASAITRLPYVFLAAIPVGFSLDHLLPLPFQVAQIDNPIAHKFVPALLIFIGLGFVVSGVRKVSRTRTSISVNPTEHTGTTNLQHWTRNPVCLGALLFCLGIGVTVQSPWIIILVLALVVGPFHEWVNGPSGVIGYERQSPSIYDRLHGRFLRISGGEGQSAVEGAVSSLLRPGLNILDAGCGTGQFARRLLRQEEGIELTLLDQSDRMLRSTHDLPATRIHGDLTDMPLADAQFDLAVAVWSIEATDDPEAALSELMRVTRPNGHVCVLFCAHTEEADALDRLMEWGIRIRGTGRFLEPDAVIGALRDAGAKRIRRLACRGPAAALLVTK